MSFVPGAMPDLCCSADSRRHFTVRLVGRIKDSLSYGTLSLCALREPVLQTYENFLSISGRLPGKEQNE